MSRHLAAYFAIVGTLAFASGGAASAGQVNIPQINIPRPQVNIPHINISRPQISVPTPHSSISKVITTPKVVPLSVQSINKFSKAHCLLCSGQQPIDGAFPPPQGLGPIHDVVGATTPGNDAASSSGRSLANPVSSTSGANPRVETASFRCRSKAAYPIARDDALGRPVPRLTKAAGSGVRPLDLYVCRSSQSAAVACCLFRFYIIITVSTSHLYTEKIISSLYSDGVASMRTKCSHMVEALQAQARFCDELACACLDQMHAEDFRRKADKYRAAAVLISSDE